MKIPVVASAFSLIVGISIGAIGVRISNNVSSVGPYKIEDGFVLTNKKLNLELVLPEHQEQIELMVDNRTFVFLFEKGGDLNSTMFWNDQLFKAGSKTGIFSEVYMDRDLDGFPEEIVVHSVLEEAVESEGESSTAETSEGDASLVDRKQKLKGRLERIDGRPHRAVYELEESY